MSDLIKTQPYTYLIGWSALGKFYYGVRTAKGCNPADLWVKYFTSSKTVGEYRALYGDPDVIEVRRLHATKEAALKWEETVIRRMGSVKKTEWLNLQNAGKFFHHQGFPRSVECRQKIRDARLHRFENDTTFREACQERAREIGSRPEVKEKLSQKAKERYQDPAYAQGNIDSHNTEEYKAAASIRQINLSNDPIFKAKHLSALNTEEYKKKQAEDTSDRWADPDYKHRVSATIKKNLASPEKRQQMSDAARASSAKRIETRKRNNPLYMTKKEKVAAVAKVDIFSIML